MDYQSCVYTTKNTTIIILHHFPAIDFTQQYSLHNIQLAMISLCIDTCIDVIVACLAALSAIYSAT